MIGQNRGTVHAAQRHGKKHATYKALDLVEKWMQIVIIPPFAGEMQME